MAQKRKFLKRKKFPRSIIMIAMVGTMLLITSLIPHMQLFITALLLPLTLILLFAGFASVLAGISIDFQMISESIRSARNINNSHHLLYDIVSQSHDDFELMMAFRQHLWVFSLFFVPIAYIFAGRGWDWYYWQPIGLTAYYVGIYIVLSILFLFEPYWRYRTLSTLFAAIAANEKGNVQRVYQGWLAFIAGIALLVYLSFRIGFSVLMIPGSFGDGGGLLMRYVYQMPALVDMEWSQQMLIASSIGAISFILLPIIMWGIYSVIEKKAFNALESSG